MSVGSLRGGCIAIGFVALTGGCHREERVDRSQPSFARGDSVVVEFAAAEFVEARILEASGETLRVQTSAGDHLTVARGDAYPLAGGATPPSTGDLAICHAADARWLACKVVRVSGARVVAVDQFGHPLEMKQNAVLLPTALTKLNLARLFERAGQRAAFMLAWKRAGKPRSPPGWSPESGERVVAEHTGGWFYARVEPAPDGGIRLRSESDGAGDLLSDTAVPLPPYEHAFKGGEFALLEPKLATRPWKPVRVDKARPDGLTVADEDGARYEVVSRKLIPISASETAPSITASAPSSG